MRTAVIGPGALGCLFAAGLSVKTACQVWLLDHNRKRAAGLGNTVLLIEENEEYKAGVTVTADPEEIGSVDLVLLCVKSFAVKEALARASLLFHSESLLIAFQNGIVHPELIKQAALPGHAALGVTSEGATLLAPGRVSHRGRGQTYLGFPGETEPEGWKKLEEAGWLLAEAGFANNVVPEIRSYLWEKLLVNAAINGLTVIYDCKNGGLLTNPGARELMVEAVKEGAAVARASGIDPGPDPVAHTEEVCRKTSENISSMLQDIHRGSSTEISAINGALVAKAEILGLETPVNRMIIAGVREIERQRSHG